jgi:peptidyl-dipeptidase Dcp
MTNPLLTSWSTDFQLPPFADIDDADFEPAFDQAMDEARANYNAIVAQTHAPDFENTIVAMEQADEALDRVARVFFNLAGADSNTRRQEIQSAMAPKLAGFSSEVTMNEGLFHRVRDVYDNRTTAGLNSEQIRVVELYNRMFRRAGAELTGDNRNRYGKIMSRLASLGTSFSQNLLKHEADWHLPLTHDDLEGLPDFVVQAMQQAGAERDIDAPVLTLGRSIIVPFLQFSTRRDLRKIAYEAWGARGANGGTTDNLDIVGETLALRQERAALLGYANFAAFKLEPEMAKTPDRVRDLLMAVWKPARAKAMSDAARFEQMLADDGYNGALEAWDWRFYAERYRLQEHDLDEAQIKPYFQLDNIIDAAFDCATKLFGLEFSPADVDLYHADARAWEVTRNGKHVAVFVGDYFARASKRSGAWCSSFRSQSKLGDGTAPVAVNVCNFVKPAEGAPSLLSFDDATTLFHEFGHALHVMLSDVTYPFISGTSVSRDFVELPSQLYEHWLEEPSVLQKFATHTDTGEALPQDLMERLLKARNADQGFGTVEYVASALVDLAFHEGEPPTDPMAKQAEILEGIGMPSAISMRHATPHFAHVFSGDGYSSGYYSYMWSEVMDADAFAAFTDVGDAFDADTAKRLETSIYSAGGSQKPEDLYKAFRGRLPGVDAILKQRGLLSEDI